MTKYILIKNSILNVLGEDGACPMKYIINSIDKNAKRNYYRPTVGNMLKSGILEEHHGKGKLNRKWYRISRKKNEGFMREVKKRIWKVNKFMNIMYGYYRLFDNNGKPFKLTPVKKGYKWYIYKDEEMTEQFSHFKMSYNKTHEFLYNLCQTHLWKLAFMDAYFKDYEGSFHLPITQEQHQTILDVAYRYGMISSNDKSKFMVRKRNEISHLECFLPF